jgi:integrase
MRLDEIRLLRWKQIDFRLRVLTVGHSKTSTGTLRKILLNREAMTTLKEFADLFPERQPDHYLFPTEKCGGLDSEGNLRYYNRDPTKPIVSWKTAWNAARLRANVQCRFHDLRHTAFTQMVLKGTSVPQVALVAGWSASNTVLMIKKYAHLQPGMKKAMATLEWRKKSSKPKKKIDEQISTVSPKRAPSGRWKKAQ